MKIGQLEIAEVAADIKPGKHKLLGAFYIRKLDRAIAGQLTCCPSAFWNAAAIEGHELTTDQLADAKAATSKRDDHYETSTHPDTMCDVLREAGLPTQTLEPRKGGWTMTMREVVRMMKDAGFRTAVISTTRNPAHSMALHIQDDGRIAVVDNGGFAQKMGSWRGMNIAGVHAVGAAEAAAEPTRQDDAPSGRPCLCGCGRPVAKRFAQGHDARVKGVLRRMADGKMRDGDKLSAELLDWAADNPTGTVVGWTGAEIAELAHAIAEQA